MGQQAGSSALGIAGAVIGGIVGGAPGAMIGSLAGGLIGSLIFNRSTKPLINDVQVGNASYGNPIPIIYGTARLSATMIWQTQVKTSTSVLGKGMGGAGVTHYHQSAAFAFCEGPAVLAKIYLDGNLFWDATQPGRQFTKHTFLVRTYTGTEDQLPDPDLSAWVAENVAAGGQNPAYRGTCYLVFVGVDLINYGNRMPQVTAEWTSTGAAGVYMQDLKRPAADVAANPIITPVGSGSVGQQGAVADWTTGNVYAFAGTVLRAWSIATGEMLYSVDQSVFLPGSPSDYSVLGLAIGQAGQYLYVYGATSSSTISWVRALNPATLLPAAPSAAITNPAGGWINSLTVIENQSPTGSREGLVGYLNAGQAFLCSVLAGGSIAPQLNIASVATGLGALKCFVPGAYDPITGITDFYVMSWGALDTSGDIILETFKTDGAVTFDAKGLGTITASIWGGLGSFGFNAGASGWFDPADGCLVLASGISTATFSMIKIDPNSLAVIWQTAVPNAWFTGSSQTATSGITQGKIAIQDGFSWHIVDTATGLYTTATAPTSGGAPYSWDGTREAMLIYQTDGQMHVIYFNYVATAGASVASVILDLCARAGVTADLVDVSAVTQTTEGFVVRDLKSAGAALQDLCHCYTLDVVESDYKLRFVPRGQASAATIAQADLASADAQDAGKFWSVRESSQQELPLVLTVKYADPVLDYQPGSAYAKRVAGPVPTVFSKRRKNVDLPVIATAIEARKIAEQWLWTMWAERWTYETALGPKYLWLDPADTVTVTLADGSSTVARIEKIETGADLSLRLSLASEDLSTYTASGAPGATFGAQPQQLPFASYSRLLLFNVPLLQDQDATDGTTGRLYFAAGSSNPADFKGATSYRTQTPGVYAVTGGISDGAAWGRASNALGVPATAFSTDVVNTLTVVLTPGSAAPVNAAYVDLMNGANPALVGAEVIQYTTAVDNFDGSWTLSGLLRGRRGTDWATDTHAVGDVVVLLAPTTVGAGTMQLAEIGAAETWKLVPPGGTLPAAPVNAFTYQAYDLKPYAPVHVSGVYSGSDIALTWLRRTRIGGLLADSTDTIPLGETTEAYEVDILDAAGTALKRTLTGLSSPAAIYTAANITTDFGTPPATLYVRVYQKSSVVGRGFTMLWHLDLASGLVISDAGVSP